MWVIFLHPEPLLFFLNQETTLHSHDKILGKKKHDKQGYLELEDLVCLHSAVSLPRVVKWDQPTLRNLLLLILASGMGQELHLGAGGVRSCKCCWTLLSWEPLQKPECQAELREAPKHADVFHDDLRAMSFTEAQNSTGKTSLWLSTSLAHVDTQKHLKVKTHGKTPKPGFFRTQREKI